MILVATTTLGTACSIYSQFFTSSASQVGLAIVMREIYRYIYLFLFPTKLFPIVSPSSFKISFQIPRSLARIDRHFQFLSFLPPPLTNDSPRLDVALTVSSSHRRLTRERGGGGGKGKGSFGRTFFSVLPPDATTRKGKRRILVLLFTGATWTLERGRRR